MIKKLSRNYHIYSTKLNLNKNEMIRGSMMMKDHIEKNCKNTNGGYGGQSTMTTKLYMEYNVLMFAYHEFHSLYNQIRKTFHEVLENNDKNEKNYYIQCWMNVYEKEQFIDWHGHWPPMANAWHGFYCVDCEPSKTTYKIFGEDIDIPSEDGLLVIGESDGDIHRTWPWTESDRPRITIAFDIVPARFIDNNDWMNHWIPI